MAITIGSNISSLQAQRRLATSSDQLNATIVRLSSGQRINRASDDAAGLAIADSLRTNIRIGQVAVRNANDGLSSIAIADSSLADIGNVLARLAELAAQSANGTFTSSQRSALQSEFVALASEVERIAVTTEFNGVKLLSGSNNLVLQVGFNSQSTSQVAFAGVQGTLASLGLAGTNSSALTFSLNGASNVDGASAARLALDAVNAAVASLAATRGVLGAADSRLRVAISNLSISRENLEAAESRIRDADVAEQAAELTRLSILQRAGTAVIAQANQAPALALTLLG
jgi:flagellin